MKLNSTYFIRKSYFIIVLFLFNCFFVNAQTIDEWYANAQQRIDTLRKGSFGIKIVDKNGLPYSGDVSVRMAKHEFPFGIAFDLYDGEENYGNSYSTTADITVASDAEIYQTERYYSFLAYSIPVEKDSTYTLTLKFAEIYFDNPGSRIFDVFIEGTKFLSDFDILEAAGGKNIAFDTNYNFTANDDAVNIELIASVDNAAIKGIEIQTLAGDSTTWINCGGDTLTTADGHKYMSDEDFFDTNSSRYPTEEQWMKAAMQKYFNYGVSGNSFKWSGIQPEHTPPDYTNFDHAVEWTQSIGWELRAHTLLWGGYDYESDHELPRWVKDLPTPQAITDTCKMRVVREVTRYKGIVKEYDVMNEPLHATYLSDIVGDSINWNCFKWARSADPDAELFINEYNVEHNWGAAEEYRDLILQIQSMGGPVTGVGVQAHFWDDQRPDVTEFVEQLNIIAETGLPIKLTEFDNSGLLTEEEQAEDLIKVFTVAFSHPSINGIVSWALSDNGAWRENSGLFDENHKPKLTADTLLYLTKELWATHFDTTVAGDMEVLFDAYYGNYSVEVSFGDTVKYFTIPCLKANEDSVFVLNELDATTKGPILTSAYLESDSTLKLVFDKPLIADSIVSGNFKFFSDNLMRIQNVEADPLSNNILEVTLQSIITPDDYLSVSYFPGNMTSTDGGKAAAFGPEPVKNLTTGLISAEVTNDGYNIEAVFNKNIRNLPENESSFTLTDGGETLSLSNLNYKEIDSSIAVFEFTTPLNSSSSPAIQYIKGTIISPEGFDCQSSSVIQVKNIWPELVSAEVNTAGNRIAALFSTSLQNVTDNLNAFSVSVDEQSFEIQSISESGTDSTIITFEMGTNIPSQTVVTLSYEPGSVEAYNGNDLGSIVNAAVTNNSNVTGLNDPVTQNLTIYPNPVKGELNVVSNSPFTSLAIFNLDGKKMMERNFDPPVTNTNVLLELNPGFYILKVSDSQSDMKTKLIIE
jgi:GH35 family endo-1,4-beta-xylanase